ncbi:MAG TPA: DHA2 family efflux MFS transporter permease subunit [Acidimicrobiales bacterium]
MTVVAASDAAYPDAAAGVTERYRWVSLGVVLVSTLMVVLDTTIVNVALPEIRDSLRAGDGVEWIVTAYLLAVAVSQPATGWLADRLGRKRVFVGSLVCFTLASLLCALAPSLGLLVVFRVLQGLGGGAMMPVGMAIVFEVFPPERRGQAMGVWGVAAMAGPTIGPTLGGYLVTSVSWHWLFLINVPMGLLAVTLATRYLRDLGHRDDRSLDVLGLVLGASGLALLLLGVSQSPQWGWASPSTVVSISAGVALLAAFVTCELRVDEPIVELRMFGVRAFSISMAVILFTAGAQYTRLVFIPLELQDVRGYTALRVGVLLIPSALATAAAMPLGGRMMDRIGPRLPILSGCTMMAIAAVALGFVRVSSPIWFIVVMLGLQGFGMGLTAAPATVAGMNALSGRFVAQASAMRSLTSQVAGATAIAITSTIVASRMPSAPSLGETQSAYNSAFLVAAGGLLVAIVLALRLPRGAERAKAEHEGAALVFE